MNKTLTSFHESNDRFLPRKDMYAAILDRLRKDTDSNLKNKVETAGSVAHD